MAAVAPPPPPAQDPRDYSQRYNTQIPKEKQRAFDAWVADHKRKGKDVLADRYDYDVNGFFLSGEGSDARGHATDRFKKPNHPTFSTESIYHGTDGNMGGSWMLIGGKVFYEPSPTNLQHYPIQELQKYFQEVEPGVTLLGPVGRPQLPLALR